MGNFRRVKYLVLLIPLLLSISGIVLAQANETTGCVALSDKGQLTELEDLEYKLLNTDNDTHPVAHIDWSSDSRLLHISYYLPSVSTLPWTDETIWNVEQKDIVEEFDGPKRVPSPIFSAALSPDFKYYAYILYETATSTVGSLTITNLATHSSISVDVNIGLSSLHWSPDSTQIALISQQKILLFDASTEKETRSFNSNGSVANRNVVWINGGMRWAALDANNHVGIWQANVDTPLLELPEKYAVDSIYLLPMGQRVAAGSQIWNIDSSESIPMGNLPASDGLWSPNELCIATAFAKITANGDLQNYVGIWDTTQQKLVYQIEIADSTETVHMAWSTDSQRIAIGESDGIVRVWGIPTNNTVS